MKHYLLIIGLILSFSDAMQALNSWELPPDDIWGNLTCDPTELPPHPDCEYSFESGGIYYWISDSERHTLMVVNTRKFYARRSCYENIYASVDFGGTAINDYRQEELDIPAEVEYMGIKYTVTEIGHKAFNGCENLKSVKLPETVHLIWKGAFSYCPNLSDIELSPNIKYLYDGTFQGCPSLLHLDLTYIERIICTMDYTNVFGLESPYRIPILQSLVLPVYENFFFGFDKFVSLRQLYMLAENPPETEIEFAAEVYENAVLYVLAGSAEAYRRSSQWGRFKNISAIKSSDNIIETSEKSYIINGNTIECKVPEIMIYSTSGRLINSLTRDASVDLAPGMYIIFDGKAAAKIAL